jgi:cytochrome c oxidase subunit 2
VRHPRRARSQPSDGETKPVALRRKAFLVAGFALLGLVFAHAAPADGPGLSPRGPNSPQAARIEDIYWLLLAITGAIFVIVEGALLVFIFRFRSRGRARDVEGPQIHGATRLELIWTAIPVVILAAIVTFILVKLPGINNVQSARAGEQTVDVKVEGHQFYWNFIYPNGVIQVQNLRLPVQRPITLAISSADVDHSWWIPSLDGKFDAIPGHTNHQHFIAERTGTYIGQCGEFCGYEHPHMIGKVKVVDGGDFDSWLQQQAQAQQNGTSDLGKQTWQGVCATCHGLDAKGGFGPNLIGNPVLTQRQAIETLVRNGRNKMPGVGRGWTDRQMQALIKYLKRFSGGSSSGG